MANVESSPVYGTEGLLPAAAALLEGEKDLVAGLANLSALIFASVPGLNWAGFYRLRGKTLVLGPFQGLPACSRIAGGEGICGAALRKGKPLAVDNVHAFPGHIACDRASKSELVIPLYRRGAVFGVLDLDSPKVNRFQGLDVELLIKTGELISRWLGAAQ
jgi:GAF domain-containing protein